MPRSGLHLDLSISTVMLIDGRAVRVPENTGISVRRDDHGLMEYHASLDA
ncbi:MAG TPA: hypothetical protein VMM60_16160 [Ilumatobacter sp.]|nr:hypothetical protein [Ilumatobacter sp.]